MFQPTDVSGCIFWFKGDSITNMNNNQDFISHGFVYNWPNTGTASDVVPSLSPPFLESGCQFRANMLNGHSFVSISGGTGLSSDYIDNILPNINEASVFYLFRHRGDETNVFRALSAYQNNWGLNQVDSTLCYAGELTRDDKWAILWQYPVGGTLDAHFPNTVNGYRNDWIVRSDLIGGGFAGFRRNGTEIAGSSLIFSGDLPGISSGRFQIGAATTESESHFVGDIAEVIFYDHRVTHEQTLQIENYLKYKYFVAGGGGAPMFSFGSNSDASGQYSPEPTLYIESVPMSGNFPLYTAQAYVISSGNPLYTFGVGTQENSTELFIGSSDIIPSSTPLVIVGNTVGESDFLMYIQSAESGNNNATLYINAAPIESGNTPLFIHGRTIANSEGLPFTIAGYNNLSVNNNTALYIATNTSSANPSVSSFYNSVDFYTYGASEGTPFNLFIQSESQGGDDGMLPLFINSYNPTYSTTADLFIQNSNSVFGNSSRMFIRGLGGLDGGLASGDSMPLYISRWPAEMATLYINSSVMSSSVSLYTCAANSFDSNATLTMSGGQQLMGTGLFPMHINAGFVYEENTTLYTHGLPSSNNNSILYINGF